MKRLVSLLGLVLLAGLAAGALFLAGSRPPSPTPAGTTHTASSPLTVASAQEQAAFASSPSIDVNGQGRVLVTPDIARVTLGVEVQHQSLATAQAEAASRSQAVRELLGQIGIADDDIQTAHFSIHPIIRHDEQTRQQITDGYMVRHLLRVTFRETTALGARLDQITQAGATTVQALQFDVADPAAALSQARERAVADARARADHLAQLTGVTVGRPLSISEGGGPVVPLSTRPAAAAPTQIEPGQTEIRVNVQIRYAIQ